MNDFSRLLLLTAAFLAACTGSDAPAEPSATPLQFAVAGRLENDKINEAKEKPAATHRKYTRVVKTLRKGGETKAKQPVVRSTAVALLYKLHLILTLGG